MTLEEYYLLDKYHDVHIVSSYHNHNYLCEHAFGNVYDYCKKALELGLEEIGISDHGPVPGIYNRMDKNSFTKEYLPQFQKAKSLPISVKIGLEIEYFPDGRKYYEELKECVNYLILGQHLFYKGNKVMSVHGDLLTDKDYKYYVDACIEAMKTGLFRILAHPDIMFYNNEEISPVGYLELERLVIAAIDNNVFLEVNVNGLRGKSIGKTRFRYPRQEYLDILKKYKARVVVSDDAHQPQEMGDKYTKIVYSYLEDEGFDIVNKIKFK